MSSENSSLGYSLDDINFEEEHNIVFDMPKEIKDKKKKSNIKKDIFEWVPLNENWKKKVLSDNFLIYDSVDEETFNMESILINSKLIKPKFIKMQIKQYLNDIPFQEFSKIINNYKINKNNEFFGDFDINKIKTRNSLIKTITKPNFKLQSDDTTLHILSEILNVDFIIFDDTTKKIIYPKKLHKNVILILKEKNYELKSENESELDSDSEFNSYAKFNNYRNNKNYNVKLIGIKINDEIKKKFERNKLPNDLNDILDKHTFLLKHAKNAIKNLKLNNKKLTIKEIMKEINSNIQTKLLDDDIDDLMIILKNLIEQELFKKSINK
jgi:hypothetical protein